MRLLVSALCLAAILGARPSMAELKPNEFVATHALTGERLVITVETGIDGVNVYRGVPEGHRVVASTSGNGQVEFFVTPIETQSFP